MALNKILFPVLFLGMIITVVLTGCGGSSVPVSTTTAPASLGNTPVVSAGAIINQVISVKAAYAMVQENKLNPDFVIIDVRTPEEYQSGHIQGAVNYDIYSADFKTAIGALARDKKYLVYCLTGIRSASAVKIMKDLEFREVYDLEGGINGWTSNGYPLVPD